LTVRHRYGASLDPRHSQRRILLARVLVTGICGPAGSSLARQLKSRGPWVLGADARRARPGGADAAAVVSPPQAPGYLWELR
ncbi:hypothetical protein N7568_24900, partial [Paenarthrobacter aurescens]|nr:hypothetical protein [Paenarthrobacter aurescens]